MECPTGFCGLRQLRGRRHSGAPLSCSPRGRRGEAPGGLAVSACSHADLRRGADCGHCSGWERCCRRRPACAEQHLRSHARFLKRSSPNCAPSDVSAARFPRPPAPPGPTFPPPTPSLLSRVHSREAAGGARSKRALGALALPPGAGFRSHHSTRGRRPPTLTHSRVLATEPRADGNLLRRDRDTRAEMKGCDTLPSTSPQITMKYTESSRKKTKLQSGKHSYVVRVRWQASPGGRQVVVFLLTSRLSGSPLP